jgi:hypothetical protein
MTILSSSYQLTHKKLTMLCNLIFFNFTNLFTIKKNNHQDKKTTVFKLIFGKFLLIFFPCFFNFYRTIFFFITKSIWSSDTYLYNKSIE